MKNNRLLQAYNDYIGKYFGSYVDELEPMLDLYYTTDAESGWNLQLSYDVEYQMMRIYVEDELIYSEEELLDDFIEELEDIDDYDYYYWMLRIVETHTDIRS